MHIYINISIIYRGPSTVDLPLRVTSGDSTSSESIYELPLPSCFSIPFFQAFWLRVCKLSNIPRACRFPFENTAHPIYKAKAGKSCLASFYVCSTSDGTTYKSSFSLNGPILLYILMYVVANVFLLLLRLLLLCMTAFECCLLIRAHFSQVSVTTQHPKGSVKM